MSIPILYILYYLVIMIITLSSIVRAGHKTGDAVELTIISTFSITVGAIAAVYVVPVGVEFTAAYLDSVSSAFEWASLYVGSIGITLLFGFLVMAFTIGWSPKGLGPTGERCGCVNHGSHWVHCQRHHSEALAYAWACCEDNCDGVANHSGYCHDCYIHPDRICPVCKDWGYNCFENGSCVNVDEDNTDNEWVDYHHLDRY